MANSVKGILLTTFWLSSSVALAQPAQPGEDSVSFVKEVAPIIAAKCGQCHVSASKGQYGIASYEALMESDSIAPHDPQSSHFIDVIESGEMPKGGLEVSESELATLKKWIAQGAAFDGEDRSKALIESPASGDRLGRGNRGSGRRGGQGGSRLKAVDANPQDVGDEGVFWYVTWETAVAEAQRSNRPIFFMSAAAQCSGVSGVF